MSLKNSPRYLLLCAALCCAARLSAADWYVAPSGNNANAGNLANPFLTISHAVATASNGDNIYVEPGTYNENVTVNKSLTLLSTGGRAVTVITGSTGLGAILIQANNVTIGGPGQGFTINGYDSANPGLEYAAVYVQGVRSNVTIRGNEVVANGEAGLLTEFGQSVSNLVVNANIFSGQTFTGAEAGDCGFGNQFTAPNVPRQLVAIPTGSGVTFTSNSITGTAGTASTVSGCTSFGQGNTLVTIDASNVVIQRNTFAGTTARFGSSLRARGTNASISCNTFNSAGLGAACVHIVFNNTLTALSGGASPSTLAGVASGNSFVPTGSYFSGATQIYLNSAQVSAIPQTPIAANTSTLANVTNTNTGEAYCSIQAAIDDALTLGGHTISVGAGTYNEDVNVSKAVKIVGAGYASTTVSGPIGGAGSTFACFVSGAEIEGLTITRAGNNTTDWNNPNLNSAGVSVSSGAAVTIRNCYLTGNRTGIDINNSSGSTVEDNVLTFNRTGMIMRNVTDNLTVTGNIITDNWTVGILFLDASGGTNSPLQTAASCSFSNNNVSGNWYGQIVDRQTGGSLPTPGMNTKNFECNWFGTSSPVVSTANSAEPGYAAQIPVAYGGSAVPPGGQPDILGPASANFDYVPHLYSGTDVSGNMGFQPNTDADGDGYDACTNDCNDGNAAINPGVMLELCNGVDDDCDGLTDEDETDPTAVCQNAWVALDDAGNASITGSQINNGSFDNCSSMANLSFAVSPNTFDCSDVDLPQSVTLVVTDEQSNTASCMATVTVLDVLHYSETPGLRTAISGLAQDKMGWGLDLEGGVAIGGAPDDKVGTQNKQGSAFVYLQDQGGSNNWGALKQIKASDGLAVEYFGNAVSIDGSTAIVGAYGDNLGALTDCGSAFIYEQNLGGTNNWGERKRVSASDASNYAYFANAVSLENGRALVGASKHKEAMAAARGAVYIFEKDNGGADNWGQAAKLLASDGAANNFFGASVGQVGNIALVGANGNLSNRGAVYVFDGNAAWAQTQKLTASDAAVGDGFGTSLSMSSDYAIIGTPNKATYMGAAYVFKNNAGTWSELKKLTASDGATNDRFGAAVDLEGDYAYVSAVRANGNTGAVYVFHRNAGGTDNWGEIGKYFSATGASNDQFGYSVAASGDMLAVGANLRDLTGPTRVDAGAVYFFTGEDCPDVPKASQATLAESRGLAEMPSVKCSPNPFRDELAIEINATGVARLTVTDAAGRMMTNLELPAGLGRFTLETSAFRDGMYFVQVSSESGVRLVPVALVR